MAWPRTTAVDTDATVKSMAEQTSPDAPVSSSHPAVERALELIQSGSSVRGSCRETGANRETVRYHMRRRGISASPAPAASPEREEVKNEPDGSVTVSAMGRSPEDVLRAHKLNPDEWTVLSARITDGGPNPEQSWVRVNARRNIELLRTPDLGSFEPRKFVKANETDDNHFAHGSIAFLADPHCPFMDEACFRAALSYLALEQPSTVIHLGDAGNHGHLSKHRNHSRFGEMSNETIDAIGRYFYDCVLAAPDAEHIFIPGNHDARILYYMQDFAEKLAGVRPARLPGEKDDPEECITLRRLYRLDDLGIKLIDEDWKLASYPIVRELSARHGYLTGNNAERKLMETHGRSQVHGHLHRGEVVYRTKHDPLDIRVAMSVPTLAQVKCDGLGYRPDPDWTPGIGIAHVWDDERFVVGIAPFIENELLLPDGRRFPGAEA
jgi:predicted phosphodiesterase